MLYFWKPNAHGEHEKKPQRFLSYPGISCFVAGATFGDVGG